MLLVNHCSRRGAAAAEAAFELLQGAGLEVLEDAPCNGESLADLVRRRKDRVDLIVVGGGDGTLNAALDGLMEAGLPVGILPLGTANDLARTLGLPTDLAEACEVIAAGHTRRIDVGQVNGKHFFNVASIGLSVQITRELNGDVKRAWGVLAYLKTALSVLFRSRLFHAEIRTPTQSFRVKSVQIAVGNGRHYGGGMTVSEDAAIDDRQLDLYSIEISHFWQILLLLPRLKTGSLANSKYVRTMRGKSFEVITRRSLSVNTDGEITTRTPATFSLRPAALSVFVPAD